MNNTRMHVQGVQNSRVFWGISIFIRNRKTEFHIFMDGFLIHTYGPFFSGKEV